MSSVGHQFWQISDHKASAALENYSIRFALDDLSSGMSIQLDHSESQASPIANCFCFPAEARREDIDHYVRGNDLIVIRPVAKNSEFAGDVYFRNWDLELEQTLAIEVIYSIHTDLLDTRPMPTTTCQFQDGSVETKSVVSSEEKPLVEKPAAWSGDNLAIWKSTDLSIGVGVFPNDLAEMQVDQESIECAEMHRIDFQLRSEFLEKGVIRRLRMMLSLATGNNAQSNIMSVHEKFVESELPLTT